MAKNLTTLFFLAFITCVSAQSDEKINSEWKTLDKPGYSIRYPSDWELDQSGQVGTTFILFSPQESDTDRFKENVNLIIQDISAYNIDLDKYTEISEEQVKNVITNSNVIESKRIKDGPRQYHYMIYTGDQGVFHLKHEQYYWVIDKNKAFVLTLTCEADKYSDYKEIGETILNSFLIKN